MDIHPEKIGSGDLVFKTISQFESLVFSEVDNWCFSFGNGIYINVEGGFWRIYKNNRIFRVSYDHNQIFGLPAPIDLVVTINEMLKGAFLTEIKIIENTGDLLLYLTDNLFIEVFITSSGYESYSFSVDKKRYIGMGSGEISMLDIA